MTRTVRRLVFYPLFAAFAVASVVWLFRVPDRRDRLPRAIPECARWVGVHRGLARRGLAVSANPVVKEAARHAGMEAKAWEAAAGAPETRRWLNVAAADTVVTAQWPALRGGEAFGAAAWIGGWSPRLRWLLAAGQVPGATKISDHRGRPLWKIRSRDVPRNLHLVIAVEEGILLTCLAPSPGEICEMLDAYDRTSPCSATALRAVRGTAPDHFSFRLGRGPGPDEFEMNLDEVGPGCLAGRAVLAGWEHPFETTTVPEDLDLQPMAELLGGYAEGVAVVDASCLGRMVEPMLRGAWWMPIPAGMRAVCGGPAVLALFGDPYAGRYHGLRVPGITASFRTTAPGGVAETVDAVLARINAIEPWDLRREAVPGSPGLSVLIAGGKCEYGTLPENERLAFAETNGWWTVGSNVDMLRGLRAAMTAPEVPPPWFNRPAESPVLAGRVWLDLGRGARTLGLALAVGSLSLQVADADGTTGQRAMLAAARDMVHAAAAFGTARMNLTAEGDHLGIVFRLAPESARDP